MKKVVFAIVVLFFLAAAGSGGFYWYQHRLKSLEKEEQTHFTLYGNVEIRRVNLGFRVSGRIDSLRFEEGDFIPKGEVVATLDQGPFLDQLTIAEAEKEQAVAELARLENGARPQEISQARANLEERKATLKVCEADYRRGKALMESRTISFQEFDFLVAKRDEAAARQQVAQENLALLEEGFRKEEIAAGRAKLAQSEANIGRIRTSLEDTRLCCPNDGILLTRVEESGAVVREGQIIATLSLQDAVWVYVYIPEPDLGKISPGMSAEVFTDSRPDRPYRGQVGYISPEAEFTPKNVESPRLRTDLVFRVRIIVSDSKDGLRQGMPVTVRIARS